MLGKFIKPAIVDCDDTPNDGELPKMDLPQMEFPTMEHPKMEPPKMDLPKEEE